MAATPQLNWNPKTYGSVNCDMGMEAGERRISITRRFFLLLTLFDILFTFLLWIICTVVSVQKSIAIAFENEVLSYNIESSMFDIVILAVARLFLIVLFYVFIKSSHWMIIAITTAGTTTFIIAKVFLYKWTIAHNPTSSVVLLVCSFILSWGEAWFLDFRVFPSELKALQHLAKANDEDRLPVTSHPVLSRSQSDDGSAFYSPPGSDVEDDGKEHQNSTTSELERHLPKDCGSLTNNI